MSLAGYTPETRTVPLGGDRSFAVQGLSLNHVSVLVREHFPDLDAIVELFQNFDKLTPDQFQPLALSLISQAPGFVANVIALAAGEGDASDAEKLPAPVQLLALQAIGELTFTEVGGVGKAWEIVATLLKSMNLTKKFTKAPTTDSSVSTSAFVAM
jgi:hypothetical protein